MADASIYSRFLQPVKSIDEYRDEDAARAARQNQNALAALTLQQQTQTMQQASEDRNALARIAAGLGAETTPEQRIAALRGSGRAALMTQADALEKGWLDRRKTEAEVGKLGAETAEKARATKDKARNDTLQRIMALSTPESAQQQIAAAVRSGELSMEHGTALTKLLPADPSRFPEWQMRVGMAIMQPDKAAELLTPLIQTRDTGGAVQTLAVDRMTGAPRVTGAVAKTQSPDNAASVGAQYAIAAANRDQAQATRDAAKIRSDADTETGIRKEFAGLPEVTRYKAALPAYNAVVKAAATKNPQADINLIYGLAKLYDPDSVVREGEYATIANSQAIPEWLKGQAQRLMGGGRLTDETKKQILEQAAVRLQGYQSEYEGARSSYYDIAKRRGLNPENVFTPVGASVAPKGGGGDFGPHPDAAWSIVPIGGGKK